MSTPKIAVIGAGPGGLMLANILHRHNVPCTVFERDGASTAREQGGSLDIHEHSGQQALEAAGLMDEFRAAIRPGGEDMKIMTKDGTVVLERTAGDDEELQPVEVSGFVKGRPEIDRPILRNIMMANLPVETIHWGSKVTSIAQVPNSKQWIIELEGGSLSAPFDLVVGADGAWSHTRSLLTDEQPFFSGVMALDVLARHVDETAPEVSALVGLGNCFWCGEGRALFFQRSGLGREASVRCYACIKTDSQIPPSERALLGLEDAGVQGAEVDWTDASMRERYFDTYFGDWCEYVKKIFLSMNDSPVLRPLYMLPVGLTWESRPGITLLGDAAHLMTPFAGLGVNVAMMDALELAQGILESIRTGNVDGDGLSEMIRQYEKGMFIRSAKDAAKTKACII